jgi:hypothetical protein
VVAREPDLIIGSWCGKKFRPERLMARPGFERTPAVRHQDVYEIKSSLILQPGPAARLAMGRDDVDQGEGAKANDERTGQIRTSSCSCDPKGVAGFRWATGVARVTDELKHSVIGIVKVSAQAFHACRQALSTSTRNGWSST